jgi:hypothetical protein
MRFHKITCAALITSLAWLSGCRPEQDLDAAEIYRRLCEQRHPRMCRQAARVEVAAASTDLPGTDAKGAVTERAFDLNDPMGCELREESQRAGP